MSRLLTAKEVAEEYYDGCITSATIRRYAREGLLEHRQAQAGKMMLFEEKVIEKFIAGTKFGIKAKKGVN